ncbi:MAG TPA: NAD-dependent epimerase/dehydratase family protein, partial [Bacillota bacterium]|nr:NAD-dependent epimerase/dehydratase family protein [Bacillota bacterium]
MAAMKVLVTGGAGFIGSHIADKLVEKGHEVVVVDNLSTGSRDNVNAMCTFYELDITDARLEQIFCREKPQIVIHHAAQIEVPKSLAAPALDANVNILGTINILECCRRYGVTKLVYASSAAVYGTPAYLPIDEKHPISPLSNYGVSKYAAELYIKCYAQLYGVDYTVLRYANVYGPRQSHSGEGGVISIFASGLLAGKAPLIQGNG